MANVTNIDLNDLSEGRSIDNVMNDIEDQAVNDQQKVSNNETAEFESAVGTAVKEGHNLAADDKHIKQFETSLRVSMDTVTTNSVLRVSKDHQACREPALLDKSTN